MTCTAGPADRPFEEQHSAVSVAIVTAGTFQYRAAASHELLTPGSLLLGHPGKSYECRHEHATGDRCIAFHFEPDWFSRVTRSAPKFRAHRIPPIRALAPLVASALSGPASWEELAVVLAVRATSLANDVTPAAPPSNAVAKITRAVRIIERHSDRALPLEALARAAGLSEYYFLRTFASVTGVTPHQFALRARLRNAALLLTRGDKRVIDIALDCGFGDVSNFNRTFRAEFGVTPRQYRCLPIPRPRVSLPCPNSGSPISRKPTRTASARSTTST